MEICPVPRSGIEKTDPLGRLERLILRAVDDVASGAVSDLIPKAEAFYKEYLALIEKHGVLMLSCSQSCHNSQFIAEAGNNYPEMVSWHRFDERFDDLLQERKKDDQ